MARGRKKQIITTEESPATTDQDDQPPEDLSNPVKRAKFIPEMISNSALPNKNEFIKNIIPRRSQRNNHIPNSSSQDQGIAPVTENIEISDTEELLPTEEPVGPVQYSYGENSALKVKAILNGKKMEEKIDNLSLLLAEQGNGIKQLLSTGAPVVGCVYEENPSLNILRINAKLDKYKNMHIDAEKKMDDLKEQNIELNKKLEIALAKLEGYEKGQMVLSEVMQNILPKAYEMAWAPSSPHLLYNGCTTSGFRKPNSSEKMKRAYVKSNEKVAAKAKRVYVKSKDKEAAKAKRAHVKSKDKKAAKIKP